MARSELLAQSWIDGQRQKAGRCRYAIFLDDDGTVVKRRRLLENAQQQVVSQYCIERDAALDVTAQADLAFDHDDRANVLRRQHAGRDHQLFDRFLFRLRFREVTEKWRPAEVRERTPNIRLE